MTSPHSPGAAQTVPPHPPLSPQPPASPQPTGPYPTGGPHQQPPTEDWLLRHLRLLVPKSAIGRTGLVLTTIAAVATVLLFRAGIGGFGVFAFITITAVLLIIGGRRRLESIVILALAVLLAAALALRDSGWLQLGLTLLTISCVVAATMVSKRGSWFDMPWTSALVGAIDTWLQGLFVPAWLTFGLRAAKRSLWPQTTRLRRIVAVRLVVIVLPMLGIVFALLASADALFAGLIDIDLEFYLFEAMLFGVGGWLFATLLRCSTIGFPEVPSQRSSQNARLRVSIIESMIALGGLAILLGGFVGVQLLAELDSGKEALARRGVSYADYARSGYTQLLMVVAVVTLVLVVFNRLGSSLPARQRPIQRYLSILIVALTLAVVAVALRRLYLYCEAFGLTMLRLICVAGAIWITISLLMIATAVLGVGQRRNWLPGAAGSALVIIALGFAFLNPQRIVVEYNLDHAATVPLDLRYLTSMSADAVPSLVDALPRLDPKQVKYVRDRWCGRYRQPTGWSQTNYSRIVARQALDRACL